MLIKIYNNFWTKPENIESVSYHTEKQTVGMGLSSEQLLTYCVCISLKQLEPISIFLNTKEKAIQLCEDIANLVNNN